MRTTGYQRTRARVVRAGDVTSYLSIEAWCGGQVAVRVSTASLILATELSRDQLSGTELTLRANLAATADTDVDPGDFRLELPARLGVVGCRPREVVESLGGVSTGSRDKDASAEGDTASVGPLVGARGSGCAVSVSGSGAVDGGFEVACPFVGGVEGELVGGGLGGL